MKFHLIATIKSQTLTKRKAKVMKKWKMKKRKMANKSPISSTSQACDNPSREFIKLAKYS